jgi:hypothetical protein
MASETFCGQYRQNVSVIRYLCLSPRHQAGGQRRGQDENCGRLPLERTPAGLEKRHRAGPYQNKNMSKRVRR